MKIQRGQVVSFSDGNSRRPVMGVVQNTSGDLVVVRPLGTHVVVPLDSAMDDITIIL